MRMIRATVLAAAALVTPVSQALAVTLSFDPASQTVSSEGAGQINVDIQGVSTPPGLGGFDLTVSDSLGTLTFTSITFGTQLGDPTNHSQTIVSSTAPATSSVEFREVSLLTTLPAQPANFTLATISFVAGAPGITTLGISKITLSDGNGSPILNPLVIGATVTVAPEPTCALLVGSGLLCLAARRSRRNAWGCLSARALIGTGSTNNLA